jgi:hypothetical protein
MKQVQQEQADDKQARKEENDCRSPLPLEPLLWMKE